MAKILLILFASLFLNGCANIPIDERGLAIGKDTTANIEDLGVASVNRQF